jgi:hypothetical protein
MSAINVSPAMPVAVISAAKEETDVIVTGLSICERGICFRALDIFGYIPLVGTLAGLARIVGAFAYKHLNRQDDVAKQRANMEMVRGIYEFAFPIIGGLAAFISDMTSPDSATDTARGSHYIVIEKEHNPIIYNLWKQFPDKELQNDLQPVNQSAPEIVIKSNK